MTIKNTPYELKTFYPIMEASATPVPFNPVTGRKYFGQLAADLLEMAQMEGYASHEWATLQKWNSIGETIAKGEKGWMLVRTLKNQVEGSENSEPPARFFLFNRCQLESYQALDTCDKSF